MRDMPVFTTEYGVASLTLAEIPYRKEAYIRIQTATQPDELLKECVSFCRACGAVRIYAAGHEILNSFPLYTEIWQMRCARECLSQTDAALFPVQHSTLERWREYYNKRMRSVPNAATMTVSAAEKLLQEGSGYFVHRGDLLIGIGKACGDRMDAVISLAPGGGREVVCALNHALSGDSVTVEVASENMRAVALYEKLGFRKTALISQWYQVL